PAELDDGIVAARRIVVRDEPARVKLAAVVLERKATEAAELILGAEPERVRRAAGVRGSGKSDNEDKTGLHHARMLARSRSWRKRTRGGMRPGARLASCCRPSSSCATSMRVTGATGGGCSCRRAYSSGRAGRSSCSKENA